MNAITSWDEAVKRVVIKYGEPLDNSSRKFDVKERLNLGRRELNDFDGLLTKKLSSYIWFPEYLTLLQVITSREGSLPKDGDSICPSACRTPSHPLAGRKLTYLKRGNPKSSQLQYSPALPLLHHSPLTAHLTSYHSRHSQSNLPASICPCQVKQTPQRTVAATTTPYPFLIFRLHSSLLHHVRPYNVQPTCSERVKERKKEESEGGGPCTRL